MILKKTAAALVAATLLSQVAASAAGVCNVKYDIDAGTVTVSGTATSEFAALEILKLSKTEADIKNAAEGNSEASALGALILHADQTAVAADGSFSFVFKMPEGTATETYAARISTGSVQNSSLIYVDKTDFDTAFAGVNADTVTSSTAMASAIESGKNHLGFNSANYDKLTPAEKEAIAAAVLAERDSKPSKTFANSSEFLASYNSAELLQMINHCKAFPSDFNASDLLLGNDDILGLSGLEAYATFSKLSESVKAQVLNAVCAKGGYTDFNGVKDEFSLQTVSYALYNAKGSDEAFTILNDNNGFLQLTFTSYNLLIAKSSVDKQMINVLYSSKNEITEKFNTCVSAALLAQSQLGGGGTGGGTGGGISKPNTNVSVGVVGNAGSGYNVDFADLGSVAWAKDSILALAEKGIVSGKGNGMYCPLDNVTREEFVKMLVSALGCLDGTAECDYEDVDKSAWYYRYVASAVKAGLVSGISETEFGTGMNISRQDIAVLISRAAAYRGIALAKVKDAPNFTDGAEISGYAQGAVTDAAECGLINGTDTGAFEPLRGATRAETAKILSGFVNML